MTYPRVPWCFAYLAYVTRGMPPSKTAYRLVSTPLRNDKNHPVRWGKSRPLTNKTPPVLWSEHLHAHTGNMRTSYLTTSFIHFSLKGGRMDFLRFGSERVNLSQKGSRMLRNLHQSWAIADVAFLWVTEALWANTSSKPMQTLLRLWKSFHPCNYFTHYPHPSFPHFTLLGLYFTRAHRKRYHRFNPFTPKGDQFQISRAASPGILYHTVWRNLLFIALLSWKMIILPIITTSLIHFLFGKNGERTF